MKNNALTGKNILGSGCFCAILAALGVELSLARL